MKVARTVAILVSLSLSGAALAQMDGRGHGMGGPPGDVPQMSGGLLVAPDGKALFVKRTTATSGSTTTTTTQLVAVSTAGAVAWTWAPPAAIHDIAFPTDLVAVAVGAANSTAASSQIVGLSLASGTQEWSTSLDGMASELTATSNGLLCVVAKVATGGTRQTVTRTLVSINNSGAIAWSLPLD